MPSLNDGGAERVFLNLACDFIRRGFDIDLIVSKKFGPYVDQIPDGVNVFELYQGGQISKLKNMLKYVLEQKPKRILSALPEANFLNILARKFSRHKYECIISQHNVLEDKKKIAKSVIKNNLKFFMIHNTYKMADRVIAVSQGVADEVMKFCKVPRDKITVIYNPIYDPSLPECAREATGHNWLDHKDSLVIITAGRMIEQKDHATLIKAFAKVRAQQNAKLIILGEGPLRGELEELISSLGLSEHIAMPGFVQNPYSWIAKANLFVLSSIYEGFGNVLVEAMSLGTPVISTNCKSGPSEILEDGKYGALVPIKDKDSLANAMSGALNAQPDKEKLISRAKEFSVERAAQAYFETIMKA